MKKFVLCLLLLLTSCRVWALGDNGFSLADTTRPLITMIANSNKIDSNVLVVIDGIVLGVIRDLRTIEQLVDMDNIKSVNVSKDSLALAKYGYEGKHGAIEISSINTAATLLSISAHGEKYGKDIIYSRPEMEASFRGGDKEWRKFLEKNCNPFTATDNGAPRGAYIVKIKFTVDTDGSISDIVALTAHGYGMEKESIRVLKLSPKWEPAIQNGRKVKASRIQPIGYKVAEE